MTKETPEKQTEEMRKRQIELLKIESYDAWVNIQVANQTIKDGSSTMMRNAQIIAELEEKMKG